MRLIQCFPSETCDSTINNTNYAGFFFYKIYAMIHKSIGILSQDFFIIKLLQLDIFEKQIN